MGRGRRGRFLAVRPTKRKRSARRRVEADQRSSETLRVSDFSGRSYYSGITPLYLFANTAVQINKPCVCNIIVCYGRGKLWTCLNCSLMVVFS